MKRQLSITALTNAKKIQVENRILNGDYPAPNDVKQVVNVDTDLFYTKMLERPQFGLLPPNVRWMSRDGHSLIIEEPAGYKSMEIRQGGQGSGAFIRSYKLWLPRLVYGISPDASFQPYVSHLYCLPNGYELEGDLSLIYWLPLPNIFKTGAICTHTLINEHSDLPYHSLINRAISDFWGSEFNHDVGDFQSTYIYDSFYCQARDEGHRDAYEIWEKKTPEKIDQYDFQKLDRVQGLKTKLLQNNHTYSMGLGDSERFMTTLVALGLENSL